MNLIPSSHPGSNIGETPLEQIQDLVHASDCLKEIRLAEKKIWHYIFSMHSPEATICCSNPMCQAPNLESQPFCHQCRTPLARRYLWAFGKGAEAIRPGQFLAERYWCKSPRVFIDTKPGILPESLDEPPEAVDPYLRLIPYWLHIPQVYALISSTQQKTADVVLLERAPLYGLNDQGEEKPLGGLMPELDEQWAKVSALRQLNWLWQIAKLWEPLAKENVVCSLLDPALLRVDGGVVRLLELQSDSPRGLLFHPLDGKHDLPPSLVDLGKFWRRWQASAQGEVRDFLTALCTQLVEGQLVHIDHLLCALDRALAVCGQGQVHQLQVATLSDQGPTRQRNEDACYPASGKAIAPLALSLSQPVALVEELPLVIVCDGIGGHEGGNIASNLAIATIQPALQTLLRDHSTLAPSHLTLGLEQATLAANTVIAQRNDQENRHERQRMGTTLVMALGSAHELYITHVGDSRAYRITRTGCHQVTLDDDLASREVRLGYTLYRAALHQPGSGSLVQALGMNPSSMVRPTVQRFVVDEDCLFLLCSDGLSDHDRVEQYWQTVLLPVLEGRLDMGTASQQLVEIANQKNGHDNVTVGLVYCRVLSSPDSMNTIVDPALARPVPDPVLAPTVLIEESESKTVVPSVSQKPTQRVLSQRSQPHQPPLWFSLAIILGLAGVLAYLLLGRSDAPFPWSPTQTTTSSPVGAPSPNASTPLPSSAISSATPVPLPVPSGPSLSIQSRVQVNRSTSDQSAMPPGNASLLLLSQPPETGQSPTPQTSAHTIPVGSVLKVVGQQVLANQRWLQFKVCMVPESGSSPLPAEASPTVDHPPLPRVQSGQSGWILEEAIAPLVTFNFSVAGSPPDKCDTEQKALD